MTVITKIHPGQVIDSLPPGILYSGRTETTSSACAIYENLSRARSEVARGASGVRVSRDAMRASQLEGRRALGDIPISLVS
jgi:hypothetical protein